MMQKKKQKKKRGKTAQLNVMCANQEVQEAMGVSA